MDERLEMFNKLSITLQQAMIRNDAKTASLVWRQMRCIDLDFEKILYGEPITNGDMETLPRSK